MKSLIATASLGLLAINSSAVAVKPVSYTFTPGTVVSSGTYLYPDSGLTELTNGKYGINRISNQTEADPWVGWLTTDVKIDFAFDQAYNFDSVTASMLQLWIGNVALPDFTLFASNNGLNWTQVGQLITPESSLNNHQTHKLTLDDLDVTAQYLRVNFTRNGVGAWIFSDEITFNVPEGGATLVLLGLGFLGLAGLKRKAA